MRNVVAARALSLSLTTGAECRAAPGLPRKKITPGRAAALPREPSGGRKRQGTSGSQIQGGARLEEQPSWQRLRLISGRSLICASLLWRAHVVCACRCQWACRCCSYTSLSTPWERSVSREPSACRCVKACRFRPPDKCVNRPGCQSGSSRSPAKFTVQAWTLLGWRRSWPCADMYPSLFLFQNSFELQKSSQRVFLPLSEHKESNER